MGMEARWGQDIDEDFADFVDKSECVRYVLMAGGFQPEDRVLALVRRRSRREMEARSGSSGSPRRYRACTRASSVSTSSLTRWSTTLRRAGTITSCGSRNTSRKVARDQRRRRWVI